MKTPFWKLRFPLSALVIPILLVIVSPPAGMATDEERDGEAAATVSEEEVAGLPAWEEEDFRDGFDVRIWPERIVMWLEQENLRDLIADPRTPEEERKALKQVLAMQRILPKNL